MTHVVLTCLLIMVARVADVSLGTIRAIMTIQGRRWVAISLSIFELLIWVFVVSSVIQHIGEHPAYGFAYALGFAMGTFVGMTIERRLALGRQVVRIFTRQGPEMAEAFRDAGYVVTQFDGYGRDGPVQELFIEVGRREANKVVTQARALDVKCYYMVDDIREASSGTARGGATYGLRSAAKKK